MIKMFGLFGRSKQKTELSKNMQKRAETVSKNMLFMIAYPQVQIRQHCIANIYDQFPDIKLLSLSGTVSPQAIYHETYTQVKSLLTDTKWIDTALKEIPELADTIPSHELYFIAIKLNPAADKYFDWLSEELYARKYISLEDVKKEIDSIIPE